LWHDRYTNQWGKTLEELITSDLLLMNEATGIPTFETIRGHSWIDMTLCNKILHRTLEGGCVERKKAAPTTSSYYSTLKVGHHAAMYLITHRKDIK